MQIEWKYCFEQGVEARYFLQALVEKREKGIFLGSSYPRGYCHSCFSKEQCDAVEKLASNVQGLNYEYAQVFRGNLFASDFSMKTFTQPFVQWCPSPIYSTKFSQWVPPSEPWGTSMDGGLIFNNDLMSVIEKSIVGLEPDHNCVIPDFKVFRPSFGFEIAHECSESRPLSLNCSDIPHVDFVKLQSGVILCSSRFAKLLSTFWDGTIEVKFQPVECTGVSPSKGP